MRNGQTIIRDGEDRIVEVVGVDYDRAGWAERYLCRVDLTFNDQPLSLNVWKDPDGNLYAQIPQIKVIKKGRLLYNLDAFALPDNYAVSQVKRVAVEAANEFRPVAQ